jgi:chromosomal replication initiation ATPase DnaA
MSPLHQAIIRARSIPHMQPKPEPEIVFVEPEPRNEEAEVPALDRPVITVADIVKAVNEAYGLKVGEIVSNRRLGHIVLPRHVAAYLCRRLTKHSTTEIGRRMGGRDHSTIWFAIEKIERMMQADADFAASVEIIAARLQSRLERTQQEAKI